MSDPPANQVVLDTNVVVSALLKPQGVPAGILRIILAGNAQLVYDVRIISEYREVLARPRFSLDPDLVKAVIEGLMAGGEEVFATPLPKGLPDPDDEPFLEAAAAAGSDVPLVTGNARHYPEDRRCNVPVLSPAEWLNRHRSLQRSAE